jgi:hypothetical protein
VNYKHWSLSFLENQSQNVSKLKLQTVLPTGPLRPLGLVLIFVRLILSSHIIRALSSKPLTQNVVLNRRKENTTRKPAVIHVLADFTENTLLVCGWGEYNEK